MTGEKRKQPTLNPVPPTEPETEGTWTPRTHSGARFTKGTGSFSKGVTKREWGRPEGPPKSFSPQREASHCRGKDNTPAVLRRVVKTYGSWKKRTETPAPLGEGPQRVLAPARDGVEQDHKQVPPGPGTQAFLRLRLNQNRTTTSTRRRASRNK